MNFKNSELHYMTKSLQELISKELPAITSYKLMKFASKVNEEMKIVEEARAKLVKKYGDEKEGDIKVKEKNIPVFQKEFTEILEQEIEISFSPLKIEDLGDVKISASVLMPLEKLFG